MKEVWSKPSYLKSLFVYKSERRNILLSSINEFFNINKNDLLFISESFECLHFSATTVDDVVDNETFRSEKPSYYAREGYDKAFIAAFSTFIRFLEISDKLNSFNNLIIHYLREMLIAEEADIGLRVRNEATRPFEWFYNISSTKTANEILIFVNILHNIKPNDKIEVIEKLFFEIGRFAQMSNDKRDILINNPLSRFASDASIKLTYSMPLAIYLDEIDSSIEFNVGLNLSHKEFVEIQKLITREKVKQRVIDIMHDQMNIILNIINENSFLNTPTILKLVNSISTDEFYKIKNHEILSK